MIPRVWETPWRSMLVANIVILVGVFLYKLTLPPYVPYIHLLVDYHFGFTKRALIGAMVSLFTDKVPLWLVYALAGAVWLITAGLFVKLFRRTFGFDAEQAPLFVFMAGSPFFLKNFIYTLGHFDIFGCGVALCLLLVPAHSVVFVLSAALASMILILIHHIHFLMYVPTIAVIVVLRHYLVQGLTQQNAAVGIGASACVGALFFAAQFYGTMTAPPAEFTAYVQGRIADPSREDLMRYTHAFSSIWYQPLAREIADTWQRMPSNLLGVPVFALLIWLHAPLWRYFTDLIAALAIDTHRRIVIAGIIMIGLAYLVMFAIVFDYSRWISNWVTCLFLILPAVKALPASRAAAPIGSRDRTNKLFGWTVSAIPRVGIVRPF